MKEYKIIKISSSESAYAFGFRYNVQEWTDGYYIGNGRYCKNLKEVENFIKQRKAQKILGFLNFQTKNQSKRSKGK